MRKDFDVLARGLHSSANSISQAVLGERCCGSTAPFLFSPGQRSAAARSGPHLNLHVGFHAHAFKEALAPLKWLRKISSKSLPRATRVKASRAPFHTRRHGENKIRRGEAASHRSALQVQAIPNKSLPSSFLEKPNDRKEAVKSAKRRRKLALQQGRKLKARGGVGGESQLGWGAVKRRRSGCLLPFLLLLRLLLRLLLLADGCSVFVRPFASYICAWAYRSGVEAVWAWVRCQVQQSEEPSCFCIRL